MNTTKNEYEGRAKSADVRNHPGLSSGFRQTIGRNREYTYTYRPRNLSDRHRGRLIVFRTICGRLHAHVGCIQHVPGEIYHVDYLLWRCGASPRRQNEWRVGFSKLFFNIPVMTCP